MAEKQPTRGQDGTRTKRQEQYLERLQAEKGKRLVVDLDGAGKADLDALLHAGYGANQRAVVQRALSEAAEREKDQKMA